MKLKKLLSIILICGMLPFSVYAEETNAVTTEATEVVSAEGEEQEETVAEDAENEAVEGEAEAAEEAEVEEVAEPVMSEKLKLAIALGLLDENIDFTGNLTRGEAAGIVSRVVYGTDVESTDTDFTDVLSSNANSGDVAIANQWKIMIGYGDSTFKPEQNITKSEFLKTMVTLLGYKIYANGLTESGETYERIASNTGITKGVVFENADSVSYEECAKVLNNIYSIKVIEMALTNQADTYVVSDKTILDVMKVEKVRGIVSQNEYSSLYSTDTASEGYVVINNRDMLVGKTNVSDMLGYNVECYIDISKEDDDPTVLYATPWKTDMEEITLKDIDTNTNVFVGNKLKYDDGTRVRTAGIETVFSVIYNGVYSSIRDMSLFENGSGVARLIDNDNDGKYDIIEIYKAVDYLVDTVGISGSNYTIVDKLVNVPFKIDSEDTDVKVVVITASGNTAELGGISEWDVLSIYDSGVAASTRKIKIVISTDTISGTVKSIDLSDERTITIDDTEYFISPSYVSGGKVSLPTLGGSADFMLNCFGEICGYKMSFLSLMDLQYGILTKIRVNEEDESVIYKIFTESGEFIQVTAAEKVKIDGTNMKEAARYIDFVSIDGHGRITQTTRELIRFKLNKDGELREIETAQHSSSNRTDIFTKVHNWTVNPSDGLIFRGGMKIFGGKYFWNPSTTVMFSIPTDAAQDEEYVIITEELTTRDEKYSLDIYVEPENPLLAKVVVLRDSNSKALKDSDLNIVEKNQTIWDDYESEVVTQLTIFGRAGEQELTVAPDARVLSDTGLTPIDVSDIKKGDVFSYSLNGKGQIDQIKLVYDFSEKKYDYRWVGFPGEHRIRYGEVLKKYDDCFTLSIPATAPAPYSTDGWDAWPTDGFKIYVYDAEENEIRTGTSDDIRPKNIYGTSCSEVIVSDYTTYARVMIIINR